MVHRGGSRALTFFIVVGLLIAAVAHLGANGLLVGIGSVALLLHLPLAGLLGAAVMGAGKSAGITTGTTLHQARGYDPLVALLTLGRGRKLRETTVDLAQIAPGDAVLDVGCGTGAVTMPAKRRAGQRGAVYGIDASPEMIAEARRKAQRAGLEIDYRVAAVEALPFPDATFDVVLSSLMMHHLPDDLKPHALAEMRRVLKPGGRLLVVDFRRPTSLRDHLALPALFHRRIPGRVEELPPLVTDAGFVAVESGPTNYVPVGFVRARAGA